MRVEMKAAVIAISAAAVLSPAAPAAAEASCGGGSDAGSPDHDIGPSAPVAKCTDDSDVVGYRQCEKYGAWGTDLGMPRVAFETGVAVRRFESLLGNRTGTVAHGAESFTYRTVASRSDPLDTAVVAILRATVSLPRGLYVALEADLGGLAQPSSASAEMMSEGVFGSPALDQHRGFVVDGLGALGVRAQTKRLGFGAELLGGLRGVTYHFQSDYHHCAAGTDIHALAPVAEARARGDLWLTPWLTAGATIGTSLLERGAWMGGLYFGLHTRSFGG